MAKCLNCGKEFKRIKKRTKRNIKYCCSECYWQYHLKDILKKEKEKVEE